MYKKSEGCTHCYMYYWDQKNGKNGREIYKVKNQFNYPIQRDRKGYYKVKSGEQVYVCLTSDFFLEEADPWRNEAWSIIRKRSDITFTILTKRPERILSALPHDWGNGWSHIFLYVTIENQLRADERIPILLSLPFPNKGLTVTPFIGPISLKKYDISDKIQQIIVGGENYVGARPLHYIWVKNLYEECKQNQINFSFMDTGANFIKDGKCYHYSNRSSRKKAAQQFGFEYFSKELNFNLNSIQHTQQTLLF